MEFGIDGEARVATAVFTPRREHQGYAGRAHGGIVAAVLDEAMLKLCWELGVPGVTVRLEVELKKPVRVGASYTVRGWIEEDRGRLIRTRAEMKAGDGEVVSKARAEVAVVGKRVETRNATANRRERGGNGL